MRVEGTHFEVDLGITSVQSMMSNTIPAAKLNEVFDRGYGNLDRRSGSEVEQRVEY